MRAKPGAHGEGDVARLAAGKGLLVRHVSQIQARGGALELLGTAGARGARAVSARSAGTDTQRGTRAHQTVALLVQRSSGGGRVAFHDGVVEAQPLALVHAQLLCVKGGRLLVVAACRKRVSTPRTDRSIADYLRLKERQGIWWTHLSPSPAVANAPRGPCSSSSFMRASPKSEGYTVTRTILPPEGKNERRTWYSGTA